IDLDDRWPATGPPWGPRRRRALWAMLSVGGAVAAALAVGVRPHTRNAVVRHRADPLAAAFHHAVPPQVPPGVVRWLRVTLANRQGRPTPAPFQEMVVLDSARYAKFEAADLRNVEFFDGQGRVLPSWLESGNCNLARRSVYWVRLRNGIPARGERDIFLGFAPAGLSLLNRISTGEAPGLSTRYGQFDDGAAVFERYANFSGPALPPGWYQKTTPGGRAMVRVHDGVYLAHTDRGGGVVALGSPWAVGRDVAEMDLISAFANNAQLMAMVCSASPGRFEWTADSVGFQNMSKLEIEDNISGTPAVLAATEDDAQPGVLSIAGPLLEYDYRPVAHAANRICGGNYLAVAADSGFAAQISFDWVRLRARPPRGRMPQVRFGVVHSASRALVLARRPWAVAGPGRR
ncbi:MAG: hypothetical protein ACRD13_07735, partial [Terriglobales bacterium]